MITKYDIASGESVVLEITSKSHIQSPSFLTLQFTDRVGSFVLRNTLEMNACTLYVTNTRPFPTSFVIVSDDVLPESETVYFNSELPINVSFNDGGGLKYWKGDRNLALDTSSLDTYPLQYQFYFPDVIGRSGGSNSDVN